MSDIKLEFQYRLIGAAPLKFNKGNEMPSEKDVLIENLKEKLKEQNAELQRIAESPLSIGNVVQMAGKDFVILSMGGAMVRVKKAEKFECKIGDSVLVHTQTAAIVEKLEAEYVSLGAITTVLTAGEKTSEVEAGGHTILVMNGDTKPTNGDRIILNAANNVIISNLGKDTETYKVETVPDVKWSDIGGLEEAKQQMIEAIELPHKNKDLFKFYGKKAPKGVLLYGPPGCIDGDAIVGINRGGKGFSLTLRDLVQKFNGDEFIGENNQHYKWDKAIPTMIRCLHNGEIRLKQVIAAYPKGKKKVLKLTLADGKVLRLTEDHEVAQSDNIWTRADKLEPGQLVLTNGNPAKKLEGKYLDQKGYWWVTKGLKNHPFFSGQILSGYDLPEHRLVMEAKVNNKSLEEWLNIIAIGEFVDSYVFLSPDMLVHHIDHNSQNNHPDNLEFMSKSEHAIEHEIHKNFPVFSAKEVVVLSVEPDGETEVFDITVDEAHNFVANGIVVHNCGKTMLAKAAVSSLSQIYKKEGADTAFIYVKGPELLNKYVGESESRVRQLFVRAKEHYLKYGYPAVVFIDEADSLLAARGRDNSKVSGMEHTIVPMFLAEMDGLEDSHALVILATNRPDVLDPAIVRDGRIDRKIKITRPTEDSAKDILLSNLKKSPVAKGNSYDELAEIAITDLFSTERALYDIELKDGTVHQMLLSDTINGAMIAGIADYALTFAMRRDMEKGKTTGLTVEDIVKAVDMIDSQGKDLDHRNELEDFCEDFKKDVDSITKVNRNKGATNAIAKAA